MPQEVESRPPVGLGRRELLKRGVAVGGPVRRRCWRARDRPKGRPRPGQPARLGRCLPRGHAPHPTSGGQRGGRLQGVGVHRGGEHLSGGTISKKETFDPVSADAIGTWFCRGWLLGYPERSEPHVISTQEYVLGAIRPDRLFPSDTLASSGTEGVNAEFIPGADAQVSIAP